VAPYSASAVETCGDFTVTGGSLGRDFSYDVASHTLKILSGANLTISGTTKEGKIYVEKGIDANITLKDCRIDLSDKNTAADTDTCAFQIADDSKGNVTVTLSGDNVLTSGYGSAGLQKNGEHETTGTLTIQGDGKLKAVGGNYGAGIGSGNQHSASNIVINSGTVTATGGDHISNWGNGGGAGIGGGCDGAGNYITINGGQITATGNGSFCGGAGIGGGGHNVKESPNQKPGIGSHITINGGIVTAIGAGYNMSGHGQGAAGIGGGCLAAGRDITINGGTITVFGGTCAAGIGGGENSEGTNINITGGKVTTRGDGGAGIGGGLGQKGNGEDIYISGGIVTAIGATTETHAGAGIGGGATGIGRNIKISGGIVTAISVTTKTGSYASAGIGGGCYALRLGEGIEISGENTVVIADSRGENKGEPIGSGYKQMETSEYAERKGGLIIEGDKGELYGDVTLIYDLTVGKNVTVTVDEGEQLIISKGVTLNNEGTFQNNGTILHYLLNAIQGTDQIKNHPPVIPVCITNIWEPNMDYTLQIDDRQETLHTGSDGKLPWFLLTSTQNHDLELTYQGENYTGKFDQTDLYITLKKEGGEGTDKQEDDYNQKEKQFWIQTGALSGDGMWLNIDRMNTEVLGLTRLDVSTQDSASKSIQTVDDALLNIVSMRGKIGAQQNRLEYTINRIHHTMENTAAAESRIRDADMEEEMMAFSKQNIQIQAAAAVLAQANTSSDRVLDLL